MKINLVVLGGILAFGASLQAGTSLTITGASTNTVDSEISPYTGTLGGSPVTLVCDDYNDHSILGSTFGVDVTDVGTGTIDSSDSRFGGTSLSASTTLYEEMVWLGAQLVGTPITTGANAANDEVEIQEAIWQLPDAVAGKTSPTNTYSAESQTYTQWEQNAIYAVTGTGAYATGAASSYLTPDYNAWSIVTDTKAIGCTNGGGNGCRSMGNQEFLAYYNSAGPQSITTGSLTGTPEPASFVLIGSGLIFGAMIGRRMKARSAK